MKSTWAFEERVKLVDYHEVKGAKHRRRIARPPEQHRLDRFRRNQDCAAGMPPRALFGGLRSVTMPADCIDPKALAKLVQTAELVIDKRLERTDLQHRKPSIGAVRHRR